MKRYIPLALLALAVLYFVSTGFQCGSAETTSAKLYMQQKNWAKAEESLQKELVKNNKNEEAHYLLGQVRYELKNYTGMNEAFTSALQLGDQHKQDIERYRMSVWGSLFNEGVAYYNKGRDSAMYYDKALTAFNTAIQVMPDSANTYYVAALADYAKKNIPEAIRRLEVAVQKDPKYIDALRLLGQMNYTVAMEKLDAKDEAGSKASLQKALDAYERCYALEPNNADNIRSLIDIYERTKQTDKAMKLTSEAVEKDPSNKVYRYAYGAFLLRQDKYKEAADQFSAALKIDPGYADAEYNLGRISESIKCYAKVLEIEPHNYNAMLDLLNTYIENEQYDKAEIFLNELLRRRPDWCEPYLSGAKLSFLKGEIEKGVWMIERAFEADPAERFDYNFEKDWEKILHYLVSR